MGIPLVSAIISLRWHYPNQVPGRNSNSFLSAGCMPAPHYFFMTQPQLSRDEACVCGEILI